MRDWEWFETNDLGVDANFDYTELEDERRQRNEQKKKQRKRIRTWMMLLLCIAFTMVTAFSVYGIVMLTSNGDGSGKSAGEGMQTISNGEADFSASDYLPLRRTMEACGFQANDELGSAFVKEASGKTVAVQFDFSENKCAKGLYSFNLSGNWLIYEGENYVYRPLLESITNYTLNMNASGDVAAAPQVYAAHEWTTAFTPLIARAGGVLRTASGDAVYTNGLNAIVQNYNLGHRVFEIDFQITSDGRLAAAREGTTPRDENGPIPGASQWSQDAGLGDIDPMPVEDVLDEMLVNRDMFLVADAGWGDAAPAFAIVRAEAEKRDLALMDRVIPQIYSRDMYDAVMAVYDFPSVIFLCYATEESPGEVVAFCESKDNIRVIAVNGGDALLSEYIAYSAGKDFLVYVHTQNAASDISDFRVRGVYGLYTDYLLPEDFLAYCDNGNVTP